MKNNKTKKTNSRKASDFDALVGERIKLLRLLHNKTLKDVMQHLNISFQQYQKYETGRNKIPIETLNCISEIYDVDINVFLAENIDIQLWGKDIKINVIK